MLKFKSVVYRYTGVFLAYKEQCDYVESEEFWDEFKKFTEANQDDECISDPRVASGILIGCWQAEHGFCRGIWFKSFRSQNPFYLLVGWIVLFYRALAWDVASLSRKVGKIMKGRAATRP